MPSTSKAQRRLMAIAEHHPSQVYAKNRGVLKMSGSQLHDFAATKEKKLPTHVSRKKPSVHGTPNRYGSLARHGR